jgi:AAA+ superfamily predicted ATPase
VLLRKLDGIDAVTTTITIGATNRREDLDHALVSRFDQTIFFPLPGLKERGGHFFRLCRHLDGEGCESLAQRAEGLSGRNIKDVCEFTERRWARKLVVEQRPASAPDAAYYLRSIQLWKNERETPDDDIQ